jgi:hypothetical protein
MIRDSELTPDERKAVAALRKLAESWPASLWLFSGSGTLHVMRFGPAGDRVYDDRGFADQDYAIRKPINIPNDGGDW